MRYTSDYYITWLYNYIFLSLAVTNRSRLTESDAWVQRHCNGLGVIRVLWSSTLGLCHLVRRTPTLDDEPLNVLRSLLLIIKQEVSLLPVLSI
jgi:hypothetical protein